MKLRRMSLIVLVALGLSFGCSCNKPKVPPQQDTPSAVNTTVSAQNNDFAFQLYARYDKDGQNLFYSPYSISSALSMCYAGAKGNTATEMAKALCFKLPAEEQHKAFAELQKDLNDIGKRDLADLNVANALFGAKKNEKLLLPEYIDLLRKYYYSDLYSLDFNDSKGTAKYINGWVEKRTNDRIKDLVTAEQIEDSNDGLVLVNAIYFKGKWMQKFDPAKTIKDSFYTSSTKKSPETAKTVQMMSIKGKFPYAELPGCKVLEMPYEDKDLAMLFVLPDEINYMTTSLTPKAFEEWEKSLQTKEVQAYIPRFKFEVKLEGLPDKLKQMGMIDAFDENRADFTGIRRAGAGGDLYIMDIIHKAFVEVKEEGTEAAAATAVIMATKSVAVWDEPVPIFRADRPFLYMIVHKPTNTVLFLGKFNNPDEIK